jgi:uncharacterized membrane protein (DUF2068 family)
LRQPVSRHNVLPVTQAIQEKPEFRVPGHSGDQWIVLIGVFELVKGLLLLAAGVGILKLMHKDIAEVVEHWINVLRVDPDNHYYIHGLAVKALNLNNRKLEELSAGTFLYASLFLTEGTGLLLHKRWAQYFTIIVTGSLLPLEIYAFVHRATIAKAIMIVVNAAIVAYLALRVRAE